MDSQKCNEIICEVCKKRFGSVSTRNRHLKVFHGLKTEEKKSRYVLCPLCPQNNKEPLSCHDALIQHLSSIHNININETVLNFSNMEEFESWRQLQYRKFNYACQRRKLSANGDQNIYYICNRSDYKGFVSTCKKRNPKYGGTIHISGICPSRIVVKINKKNGTVMVKYIATHVGHADECLTKAEQKSVAEKLAAGVSYEKIIQKDNKLEKINIIARGDLAYLTKKYNVFKKNDADDMITTTVKIEDNFINFEEKYKIEAQEDDKNFDRSLDTYTKFSNSLEEDNANVSMNIKIEN